MGAIGWLLIAFIAVQPLLGRWRWRRFLRRRHEPNARVELYRRAMAFAWGATGVLAIGMARSHVSPSAIGLGLPDTWPSLLVMLAWAVPFGFAVVFPVSSRARRESFAQAFGDAAEILPRTRRERRLFVAVSLTAGFCEELLYRGFLVVFLHSLWPAAPTWAYLAIASVPFGLAHGYQGLKGIIGTTLLGLFFAGVTLYARTLWPAIVMHALVDLRALALKPPASPAAAAASASDRAPA